MKIDLLARCGRASSFSIAAALLCAALPSAWGANAGAPIKLALFDFELEDFSAGGQILGERSADIAQLNLATSEARRLIAQSGRYSLVDVSTADAEPAKARTLHTCNGCDAPIAAKLGADQSFVGIVKRISRTEYLVAYQIRNAHDGAVIASKQTELRLGADYSWSRGAAWLINHRLLDGEGQR